MGKGQKSGILNALRLARSGMTITTADDKVSSLLKGTQKDSRTHRVLKDIHKINDALRDMANNGHKIKKRDYTGVIGSNFSHFTVDKGLSEQMQKLQQTIKDADTMAMQLAGRDINKGHGGSSAELRANFNKRFGTTEPSMKLTPEQRQAHKEYWRKRNMTAFNKMISHENTINAFKEKGWKLPAPIGGGRGRSRGSGGDNNAKPIEKTISTQPVQGEPEVINRRQLRSQKQVDKLMDDMRSVPSSPVKMGPPKKRRLIRNSDKKEDPDMPIINFDNMKPSNSYVDDTTGTQTPRKTPMKAKSKMQSFGKIKMKLRAIKSNVNGALRQMETRSRAIKK